MASVMRNIAKQVALEETVVNTIDETKVEEVSVNVVNDKWKFCFT